MDTIFARATAPGKSGVAVVRISGPKAFDVVADLCGRLPDRRVASLRILFDAAGEKIDEALVILFEEGNSFTGEKVAELQLHGSIAIVSKVIQELSNKPGLRLSDPGEFTRRALENGRLDLTQVEALGDLIDAETDAQRRLAMKVFSGGLRERADAWRAKLIRAASLLEAVIDFADEDVPEDVSDEVADLLNSAEQAMTQELNGMSASERIRTGFEVAIVGAPNVGKSTLLNALAGRDAAITSSIAGTTRDIIEVRMDLGGLPITLLDTAGIRDSEDEIESLGIDLALKRAERSDLRVFLLGDDGLTGLTPGSGDIVVRGKADVTGDQDDNSVSGLTGFGVDALVNKITSTLQSRISGDSLATRERHRSAISTSLEHLSRAKSHALMGEEMYDVGAEELRIAIRVLESLVGRVDVEDLLDEIFSSFCLGK